MTESCVWAILFSDLKASIQGGCGRKTFTRPLTGALDLVQGYLFQERWIDAEETNQNRSPLKVRGAKVIHAEAQYAGERAASSDVDLVQAGTLEEGCDPPGTLAGKSDNSF